MTEDQTGAAEKKIVFVVCDDDAPILGMHERNIHAVMNGKNLPYEVFKFGGGAGSLQFMRERKSALGVVLMTDGEMPGVSGVQLIDSLRKEQLLPSNVIFCTFMLRARFDEAAKKYDLPDTVKFVQKNQARGEFLHPFIIQATQEIGLKYPSRPVQPRNDKTDGVETSEID
jgi:FixJ family two-component response regulator